MSSKSKKSRTKKSNHGSRPRSQPSVKSAVEVENASTLKQARSPERGPDDGLENVPLAKWYQSISSSADYAISLIPSHHSKRAAYATLAICILFAAAQIVLMTLIPERKISSPPPFQVRIDSNVLSSLPVKVGLVASCGCWSGNYGQASKKFKFGLQNGWQQVLNIGGGPDSSVRLLVAYADGFIPKQTIPISNRSTTVSVQMPPDVSMYRATGTQKMTPMAIADDANLFALPSNYSLWGLIPNQNFVVETYWSDGESSGGGGFGTVVDHPDLKPGSTYSDARLGHGSWIFEVPLPAKVQEATAMQDFMPIDANFMPLIPLDSEAIEKAMIIVGIGIFSGGPGGGLIGFAPAPPHGFLQDAHSF